MLQLKESCLYVNDLEKARKFYGDILGLPVIREEDNRHVFFRAGNVVLLCFNPEVTKHENELPPHYASGHQHLAFEVDEEMYDFWKTKLQEKGVVIIHEQVWSKQFKSFYFNDYEQNVLEIVMKNMWD